MPTSNGAVFVEIVPCASHVTPPSNDRLNAMTLFLKSFHATYTSPFGPTNGTAPIPCPGPEGLSTRAKVKDAPESVERATWIPPWLALPPLAESQATYTRSRNGLAGFASAVIIGLSLKWFDPL